MLPRCLFSRNISTLVALGRMSLTKISTGTSSSFSNVFGLLAEVSPARSSNTLPDIFFRASLFANRMLLTVMSSSAA